MYDWGNGEKIVKMQPTYPCPKKQKQKQKEKKWKNNKQIRVVVGMGS